MTLTPRRVLFNLLWTIRGGMTADRNSSVKIPDVLVNFPTGIGFLANDNILTG